MFAHLLTLTLAATAAALPQLYEPGATSCGGASPACPSGETCVPTSDRCTDMTVCVGICQPSTAAPKKYDACSVNSTADNHGCAPNMICISDPREKSSCDACEAPGICISEEVKMCGGIGGIQCMEEGTGCYEDPRDGCNPETGGRDCSGICV